MSRLKSGPSLALSRGMTTTFRSTTHHTRWRWCGIAARCVVLVLLPSLPSAAQGPPTLQRPNAGHSTPPTTQESLSCVSKPGERTQCKAMTAAGVALVKSTGPTACVLGKNWGYDDTGVWVLDGCSGEFVEGRAAQDKDAVTKGPAYIPNAGFR